MDADVTPDVLAVSVCLITKAFNPEKYNALLQILFFQYARTGDRKF
jgi:hypothetical protein